MADAADFVLVGARSLGLFSAGDRNVGRVDVQETTGTGHRANVTPTVCFGTGNQLVFVGTLAAFTASNPNIDPAPPAQFF
jgi:hypothetical protein